MLWEVELQPLRPAENGGQDLEIERAHGEYNLLTHSDDGDVLLRFSSKGYLLEGEFGHKGADRLTAELLRDPLVDACRVGELNEHIREAPNAEGIVTVLPKPGVMDPVADSVQAAARDLGVAVESVRTFRRYYL